MTAHAKYSPSGSKKLFACPGSLVLEAAYPNKSNEHSDAGTAMHDLAAWHFTTHRLVANRIGDYITVSRPGEPERKVKATEEMADLVQEYTDVVRRAVTIGNYWVEQRVDFSEFVGVEGQFGTADVIALDEVTKGVFELIVMDLKTGYHPVEVEGNTQLMIYALGALAWLRDKQAPAAEPTKEEDDDDLF